jgi:hypothetical protein
MWGFAGEDKDFGNIKPSVNKRKIGQNETNVSPNVSPTFPHSATGGETILKK